MAASCGIHIDQRRFCLVSLEGSAKKHKIVAHATGEIEPGEDPVEVVAAALRQMSKKNKVPRDNVALAVDSGLASFRTLTLPFDDPSKIEDVIKFEVESDLPQWDIDDVIVDFIVTDSKPGVESTLLVTALPKERLAMQLEACERGGLEASDAELDGTAVFNAAHAAGILDPESAQVLVHVGDATTAVVVVSGGRLVSMRAIRAGAAPPPVRRAAEPDEDEDEGDEGGEGDEGEKLAEVQREAGELERRRAQTSERIRRELARTVSAAQTEHPLEAIYLCGAQLVGGVTDEYIAEVPVFRLNALPATEGLTNPEELTVAYGAALNQLGGGAIQPHLRREDLRFTGKLERLELPLAVFALLLLTLIGVQWIDQFKKIESLDEGNLSREQPIHGDMHIWLLASNGYMFPDSELGYPGRLTNPPEDLLDYARKAERGEDDERTKFEEIRQIKTMLGRKITALKTELGQISTIRQPQSALQATTLLMDVIDGLGEQVGRFAIRAMTADYVQGGRTTGEYILVKLDMDFFAENSVNATEHYSKMVNAIEAQDWCTEHQRKSTEPFDDDGGISVDGMTFHVDLSQIVSAEALADEELTEGEDA